MTEQSSGPSGGRSIADYAVAPLTAVTARGVTLRGRGAEVYLNRCPPERPCTETEHQRFKATMDGTETSSPLSSPDPATTQQPATPRPPAAPTRPRPGARPSPPSQVPNLLQRAGNLVRDGLAHAADGGRKVPQEVYDARLATCHDCPRYRDNHCTHRRCGCQMASSVRLLGALWWASKSCPDDPSRWGKYAGPESPGVALPVVPAPAAETAGGPQ